MIGWFEEIEVGAVEALGSYTFTREAIVRFARRFDPQAFHVDEEAARNGPFGRLAASGWHTAAIWMKLNVAHAQAQHRAMAERGLEAPGAGPSPGFKNLQWLKPVYVDDTIAFAATITSKRPTSNPARGLVFRTGTGTRVDGTLVFSFEGCVLVPRRLVGVVGA